MRGEFAENFYRKDFTPEESVDIWKAVEPLERAAAEERMRGGKGVDGSGERGKKKNPAENSQGVYGAARDKVGALVGVSGRTMEKRRAVVEAAREAPEQFGKLLDDMNRTGRADGPFKGLKVARQAELIQRETPPLPKRGPCRVIICDPPWPYEIRKDDPSHRATHPYPQVSIEQICAMLVTSIAHRDSVLWLWTTNHHIRQAFEVLDRWEFRQVTILTWFKDRMGPATGCAARPSIA